MIHFDSIRETNNKMGTQKKTLTSEAYKPFNVDCLITWWKPNIFFYINKISELGNFICLLLNWKNTMEF